MMDASNPFADLDWMPEPLDRRDYELIYAQWREGEAWGDALHRYINSDAYAERQARRRRMREAE